MFLMVVLVLLLIRLMQRQYDGEFQQVQPLHGALLPPSFGSWVSQLLWVDYHSTE